MLIDFLFDDINVIFIKGETNIFVENEHFQFYRNLRRHGDKQVDVRSGRQTDRHIDHSHKVNFGRMSPSLVNHQNGTSRLEHIHLTLDHKNLAEHDFLLSLKLVLENPFYL